MREKSAYQFGEKPPQNTQNCNFSENPYFWDLVSPIELIKLIQYTNLNTNTAVIELHCITLYYIHVTDTNTNTDMTLMLLSHQDVLRAVPAQFAALYETETFL